MTQCPRCQHDNPVPGKFCAECGARLALTCTVCAAELPNDAKFCLSCGAAVRASEAGDQRLVTDPQTPTPGPRFQPHVQYVTTPDGVRIAYATFGSGGGV